MSTTKKTKTLQFSTKAIHVGGHPDPSTGAIMPPIYQTSTFVQKSPGKHQGYEYGRCHNPTRTRLEECLASLEGAKYAISTSSGLSAMMLLVHSLPHGSTVLCGDDVYGGTYRMFTTVFDQSYNFLFEDTTNIKRVEKIMKEHRPAMLWLESPSNPLLKVSDLAKLCSLAKKKNCLVVVDNTFASPYFQNPLELGADVAVHSMTKYLNGHSDVVGGAAMLNSKKLYEKLWYLQKSLGPTPSPFDSWLVLRGLKTLPLRMEKHAANAMEVATFLEKHKKVEKVLYPGLPSHPQHSVAKSQMKGFSGMVTCYLKGGAQQARSFLSSVEIFSLAESLGGVESMVESPAIMTHASIPKKVREQLGLHNNLVRLSVGIEDSGDLIKDLQKGLKKI